MNSAGSDGLLFWISAGFKQINEVFLLFSKFSVIFSSFCSLNDFDFTLKLV